MPRVAPARDHLWMLMGAPVLVTPGGAVYGFGFGMRTLGLHAGGAVHGFERVQTATPPSTGRRVVVLDEEWISVDPWMVESSKADGLAKLRALASAALEFVER